MENPELPLIPFTRRDLLKSGAVLLGASLLGCEGATGIGTLSPETNLKGNASTGRSFSTPTRIPSMSR